MIRTVLKLGKRPNGGIYTQEEVLKGLERQPPEFLVLGCPVHSTISLDRVAGKINLTFFDENELKLDFTIFDTTCGLILRALLQDHLDLKYALVAIGMIEPDKIITNLFFPGAYVDAVAIEKRFA